MLNDKHRIFESTLSSGKRLLDLNFGSWRYVGRACFKNTSYPFKGGCVSCIRSEREVASVERIPEEYI
jgi:hypothetical protein